MTTSICLSMMVQLVCQTNYNFENFLLQFVLLDCIIGLQDFLEGIKQGIFFCFKLNHSQLSVFLTQ